jgi:cobalt/nickel transport system permease protein
MTFLERNFLDIRNLDLMARGITWIHRLDPRAKLITTLVFIVTVVSVDKYTIAQLIPFALYPVALISLANLPAGYFLKKICLVAPFAVLIGMFNPLIDRTVLVYIGSLGISGGWISFGSIMLRFGLTVGTALVLIGITSFSGLCLALEKLRVPRVFVVQLLFLYRYLFVLLDEAVRMSRARTLRTLDTAGPNLKTFGSMVGHLLLRATSRAERIHLAMLCRAFDGHIRLMKATTITMRDIFFVLGWSSLFLLFRLYNISEIIGSSALEFLP